MGETEPDRDPDGGRGPDRDPDPPPPRRRARSATLPARMLDAALTALAGLATAVWLLAAWRALALRRALEALTGDPPPPPDGWPPLSVVVPCRNEERDVEAALGSLLAQDYPALEVVAVDDRSTDATGAAIDRLAARSPALRALHVRELPPGWLGKNHACHAGFEAGRGEWILFTDGDVLFEPGALRSAVAYAAAHRLDHLVALPRLEAGGLLERAFVCAFAALILQLFRIHDLRRPGTRAFVGVGAFNLVRRGAYQASGGHARLRHEVVDDVKLGLLLRRSGAAQGAVDSAGRVRVRWQAGLLASMRGLLKNSFAALDYRWNFTLGISGLLVVVGAAPLAALAGPASARALGIASLALAIALLGSVARRHGGTGLEGLAAPACALALAGVFLGSAALTSARGAVVWRGTRYPLVELRRGCLRDRDLPLDRVRGWE